MPNTYLVVLLRIEKLTELIADLRQPPIVEGSDGSADVRSTLAPDCTQMSESQFVNVSLLDLRVRDYPFSISICHLYHLFVL